MTFGRVFGVDTSAAAVELARSFFGEGVVAVSSLRRRTGARPAVDESTVPMSGFVAGTRMATPKGLRAVETLVPGDIVETLDAGAVPLAAVTQERVLAAGPKAPIRISSGAHGADRPLFVAPQQRLLVRDAVLDLLFGETEILLAAATLVDGEMVTQTPGGMVRYTRLMFDQPHLLLAEGVVSASDQPGLKITAGSAAMAQLMRKLVI